MRQLTVLSRRAFSLTTLATLGFAVPRWLRHTVADPARPSGPMSCSLTDVNEIGPFHRDGAPWSAETAASHSGMPFWMCGRLTQTDTMISMTRHRRKRLTDIACAA